MMNPEKQKKTGEIYLHIPFCVRKCAYCDFLSFPAEAEDRKAYFRALQREIRCSAEPMAVRSIFLGGGTPSLPDADEIAGLLSCVSEHFDLLPGAEISMEANPGTLTAEKLEIYRRCGVNRLSIGCQTTERAALAQLGRIHTYEDFLHSFALAREAGFENINVDLMSGLPCQTLSSWRRSLQCIAALEPEHISAYSLILEEGTPLWERRDSLQLPPEEEERQMYEETAEILGAFGYRRYEISNYAKEGRECLHNLGYWTGVEYLGFGLGAASLWQHRRYQNETDLQTYLSYYGPEGPAEEGQGFREQSVRKIVEELSPADEMAEYMILGLRLQQGVGYREFRERFSEDMEQRYGSVLRKYLSLGLMEQEGDRLRLTSKGISVSNTIFADLL